jgi:hypothetical protein
MSGYQGLSWIIYGTFCPKRKMYVAAGEVSKSLRKCTTTVTFRFAFTKSTRQMQTASNSNTAGHLADGG